MFTFLAIAICGIYSSFDAYRSYLVFLSAICITFAACCVFGLSVGVYAKFYILLAGFRWYIGGRVGLHKRLMSKVPEGHKRSQSL